MTQVWIFAQVCLRPFYLTISIVFCRRVLTIVWLKYNSFYELMYLLVIAIFQIVILSNCGKTACRCEIVHLPHCCLGIASSFAPSLPHHCLLIAPSLPHHYLLIAPSLPYHCLLVAPFYLIIAFWLPHFYLSIASSLPPCYPCIAFSSPPRRQWKGNSFKYLVTAFSLPPAYLKPVLSNWGDRKAMEVSLPFHRLSVTSALPHYCSSFAPKVPLWLPFHCLSCLIIASIP